MTEDGRPQPSRSFRWIVLVFVSLTMFGNYYVYDCISPIADLLARQVEVALAAQRGVGVEQDDQLLPALRPVAQVRGQRQQGVARGEGQAVRRGRLPK